MIDVMFCFGDEYIYSSSLADWSSIKPSQEIEIVDNDQKFSVVRNDIINYNKDFLLQSENSLKINNATKDFILEGDTIQCYFDTYYLIAINDIIDGGTNFKPNEIIFIDEKAYFDTQIDKNQRAVLQITSVDENGSIKGINIIEKGTFVDNFNEIEIMNENGSIAKISIILLKNDKKALKILTATQTEQKENNTIIKINEKIVDKFPNGQLSLKRHRLTLNQKVNKDYSVQLFMLKVEKTPFLNLPLAKDNNIEKIYNQTILTLDSKIEKLSRAIE